METLKRVAAIGLLSFCTSALSFGEIFQPLSVSDWNTTYNSDTALFGATIQQGGINLQSGLPDGSIAGGAAFTSGAAESFLLSYDPGTGLATLTVGGDSLSAQTLTVAPAGGKIDHIGIQLGTGAADDSIAISNLVLNGVADSGNVLSSAGNVYFDFGMTPPTDLSGGPVTLSGEISMGFSGTPGSRISAEIVGADASPITPEPGTWAMLGSSLVALGLLRRKRKV